MSKLECTVGIWPCGPLPGPCGGLIHEHRTDDGGLKTTVICHRKARAQASLARTFLRQTPQPAVAASVPFVIPSGFEPETHSLEGCCSIQLSYGTVG